MMVAKQVADMITSVRVLIAVGLVWLGITRGASGLTLAAWLMVADWAGDMLDGRIARRSRVRYQTWIGDHDLEVDMTVSIGLLIFLVKAVYLNFWLAGGYLLLWVALFGWQGGISHSQGMLFQAPIYGWFIWTAVRHAPLAGWTIVIFIACAVLFTWPYFPKVMLPGFLGGFRNRQE